MYLPQRQQDAKERQRQIQARKTVSLEQVSAALDNMAGRDDDSRGRDARALGHAEALLWNALFGTAEDWQRVRNILIEHMEVKS